MTKLFSLIGKGIGVTGGGGHLGSAIALGLAEAGATVVIIGRTLASLERVAKQAATNNVPGRIVPVQGDISLPESVDSMLNAIELESGSVHGWVNNAYSATSGLFPNVTRDNFRTTIDGTLTTPYMVMQSVADRMLRHGAGSIVNIASMYGMVSPQPAAYAESPGNHNPPAYGAAKAAILQLTRYLACHVARGGVRVNCISPGPFPSQAVQKDQTFIKALQDRVPMGRIGRPEDLVGAVNFLLSDAASYVTGSNIVVDGGWTAW